MGPPPPLQGTDKPLDPMDIGESNALYSSIPTYIFCRHEDSPAFDAKSYYDQLIITSSLGTLLKKENSLQSGAL